MPASAKPGSRGAVSVEVALISLLWIGLVSATFEFGRYYLIAMQLQDVSRVAARELASLPLPVGVSFEEAMADEAVREQFFDPLALVLDITGKSQSDIDDEVAKLPAVNRMLAWNMIREVIPANPEDPESSERLFLRYPGALVWFTDPDDDTLSGYSVLLPVLGLGTQGRQVVRWAQVVEEDRSAEDGADGHFPLDASTNLSGMVALRINYPFHSVVWAAREDCSANPESEFCDEETGIGALRLADDSVVDEGDLPPGYGLIGTSPREVKGSGRDLYSGTFGLGSLRVLGGEYRPFRRLMTTSAWARREVFSADPEE